MITVKQIERLWKAQLFPRLTREMLAARPEAGARLELELGRAIPAAALAMIRLDELNQGFVPLYGRLLRMILTDQQADGGWGDPMTTALCLRALLCGRGEGIAIERGLQYLANVQKTEGIWPLVPIRRMPVDAFGSAFVLMQLGDKAQFRRAVRFGEAINWFEANEESLDGETRKLWDRASTRCGAKVGSGTRNVDLWS